MSDFTFFEVHFHEFSPTNTAPFVGRGGSSREVGRGDAADGSARDDAPVEEATGSDAAPTDDGSGRLGVGPVVGLLVLVAVAAARRLLGGDELDELEADELEADDGDGPVDATPVETDSETPTEGDSGGPGVGLAVALVLLAVAAVAAVAARKLLGGDDEFDELAEIDDVA